MRLPTFLFSLLLPLSLLLLPSFAVTLDEAYETDWHIPLIGTPLRHSTFFHRPQPDSKASLLYTLTEKKAIAAINPRDGALVWRQSISKDALGLGVGTMKARPADGKVISAAGTTLRAWDATDGRLLWVTEFSNEIKDMTVSRAQDVIVLCAGGGLWKVDGTRGSVVEDHRAIIGRDDVPHSLHISVDASTFVVSLSPQEGSYRIQTTTISRNKVDTKVLSVSEVANLQSIVFAGGPGIAAWVEDHGRTLMLLSLKTQSMSTIPVPGGVRIGFHTVPNHNSFLISFDSPESSWAQIWTMEGDHQVFTKAHDIQAKPFSPTSWSASVAPNGELYFTWSLPLGASEIYSGNSKEPVYTFSGNSTSIPSVLLSVSEVIPRADSTFALRSFLTSYPDTDTHLILNGAISWTRPESLAGLKAVIWVELLDPTSGEVEGELHIEESQNIVGAYIHRVRRHIHELVTFGPAWAANLPRRVLTEITGTGAENVEVGKSRFRDTFGFRKLLIGATASGGIVAIDFAQQGKILWSLSDLLQDINGLNDVKGFYEIGKGAIGLVLASGRYIEMDAFEGKVLRTEDEKDVGQVMSTSLVGGAGDKKVILGVIRSRSTGELRVKYFGGEKDESVPKELYLTIPDSFGDLHGFKVSSEFTTAKKTFSFSPPEMELVVSVAHPIRPTPPASIGKVMGDRSVMYKYLNPNIVLVTTMRIDTHDTASVYLLDSVSGAILYTATHHSVDKSKPIVSLLCENWFVYTFFAGEDSNSVSDVPAPKGYQIVVTELYESPLKNDRGPLRGANNFSSFEAEVMKTKPFAITQSYVSPVAITSLSATSTKRSITTIDILAFLPYPASLLSIPKRILDPRRPVGRDPDASEREEGLFKYDPVLPVDHRSILSHKRDLLFTQGGEKARIITSPSLMESTSLVFLYDDTDLFGTRLTPSGAFDMLGKGFGKGQLIVTVLGLAVGVWFVAPMVRRKQINQRWAPMSG